MKTVVVVHLDRDYSIDVRRNFETIVVLNVLGMLKAESVATWKRTIDVGSGVVVCCTDHLSRGVDIASPVALSGSH